MIAGTFVVLIAAHFVFRWEPLQGVPSPEFVQSYRLMSIAGAATILMSLVFLNRRHEEAFRSRLLRQTELLIQSEKLSSLGIMSAGIAHEINNPLTAMTLQLDILQERYRNLNGFDG